MIFNLRFSTELTHIDIQSRIETVLDKHDLKYSIDWNLSGQAFLTPRGKLVTAMTSAVKDVCGIESELSTAGGTSDGRFIAPTGAEVAELGPVNESIHKINENVNIDELDQLTEIYEKVLQNLMI